VAKRTIQRETIIDSDDLVRKEMNITRMRHSPFTKIQEITGKQARRTIVQGRIIDDSMIEIPPVVQNGEMVTIRVKEGTTVIQADAVSRADGYAGEMIPVYCLATRRMLKGIVQDNGLIHITNARSHQ